MYTVYWTRRRSGVQCILDTVNYMYIALVGVGVVYTGHWIVFIVCIVYTVSFTTELLSIKRESLLHYIYNEEKK